MGIDIFGHKFTHTRQENGKICEAVAITLVGIPAINAFLEMMNRALNCWDTAPSELKELADCIQYGYPLQNYNGVPKKI